MDSGDDESVAAQPLPITAVVSSTDTIIPQPGTAAKPAGAPDEDVEGEDELLPAMADDDYSAQLSWQSESKDNLK
jgi:transcription initiation factor TFIID subunit 11